MSADNWAVCPRCLRNADAAKEAQIAKADAAYGKVPIEEFERLREESQKPVELDRSFREDWEIYGASAGVVQIHYSGHCKTCGLNLKIHDEHPLPIEDAL